MGGARQDAGPPLMEGWMDKRGPTLDYKWMRRWCVLTPTALNYFADESLKVQKGTVPVRRGTRVEAFLAADNGGCNPSAPGEAVKHHREKPHGFVLDVDPSGGRARHLYYFDAGDQAALKVWAGHIARAVAGQRASSTAQALPATGAKKGSSQASPAGALLSRDSPEELRDRLCSVLEGAAASGQLEASLLCAQQQVISASPSGASPAGALFGHDQADGSADSPARRSRAKSRGSIVDAGLVSPRGMERGSIINFSSLPTKAAGPPGEQEAVDLEQLRGRLRGVLEEGVADGSLDVVLEQASPTNKVAPASAPSAAGELFGCDRPSGSSQRVSRAHSRGSVLDSGLVSPPPSPRSGAPQELDAAFAETLASRLRLQEGELGAPKGIVEEAARPRGYTEAGRGSALAICEALGAAEPPSSDDHRAARGSLLRVLQGAAQRRSGLSVDGSVEAVHRRQRILCQEIARQAVAETVEKCIGSLFKQQQEDEDDDVAALQRSNKLTAAMCESKRCSLSHSQTPALPDEEVRVEVHTSPERFSLTPPGAGSQRSSGDAIPAGRRSLLQDPEALAALAGAQAMQQQLSGAAAGGGAQAQEQKARRRASLEAVRLDPSLLAGAPASLLQDKTFIQEAVEANPEALAHALIQHRSDRDIVLAAVAKDGRALRYSGEILRGDKEVVLAAVMQESDSLAYASEELKKDETLIIF